MSDYIKRKEALEIVKRTSGDYATAFCEIKKLPAVGVKSVGMCKACEYRRLDGRAPFMFFYCSNVQGLKESVCETDFCSHFKPKQQEE